MDMLALRHWAGALVYDWPRFVRAMTGGRGGWMRFHNRDEHITIDPPSGGVRCDWQFGSSLHLCNISRLAGRALLRRALREWPVGFEESPRSGAPRISFVIGHRGAERIPLLLATLATIGAQSEVTVECVVVEQSRERLLPGILPSWVRYIHTPIPSDSSPYNRSWALNVGARIAQAPLLVLHDNDMLVPARYASSLVALHEQGWEMIDAKRFIFYLDDPATAVVLRDRAIPSDLAPRPVAQNLLGGSFAADRQAYFDIGGFDESYVGWGGEDNELFRRASTRRARRFGYAPLIHLWHAPQPEKLIRETEGLRRFRRDENVPVEERIARVRAQSGGRLEGAFVETSQKRSK
jgi:N-terminal domain of galactosyltransferase